MTFVKPTKLITKAHRWFCNHAFPLHPRKVSGLPAPVSPVPAFRLFNLCVELLPWCCPNTVPSWWVTLPECSPSLHPSMISLHPGFLRLSTLDLRNSKQPSSSFCVFCFVCRALYRTLKMQSLVLCAPASSGKKEIYHRKRRFITPLSALEGYSLGLCLWAAFQSWWYLNALVPACPQTQSPFRGSLFEDHFNYTESLKSCCQGALCMLWIRDIIE